MEGSPSLRCVDVTGDVSIIHRYSGSAFSCACQQSRSMCYPMISRGDRESIDRLRSV
jgi:hypothetical protein